MTTLANSSLRALAALAVALLALAVVGTAVAGPGKPGFLKKNGPAAVAKAKLKAKAGQRALKAKAAQVVVKGVALKAFAEYCKAQRDDLGVDGFAELYGEGKQGLAACLQEARETVGPIVEEAARACRAEAGAKLGALKECVATTVREDVEAARSGGDEADADVDDEGDDSDLGSGDDDALIDTGTIVDDTP
jgi:hypothetical protein